MTPKAIQLFDNEFYAIYQYENLTTIWELQDYFPKMEQELYVQLKNDIKKNGLNDPILYFVTEEGINLVIDGHRRLKACIELKKQNIPTKEVKENFRSWDEIQFWMLKNQCQKRNLSTVEKVQMAFQYKEIIEKKANENLSKAGKGVAVENAVDTYLEIAKIAGVSRTTIARYNYVIEKSPETIINKMKKEEISITTAYNYAKKDEENKTISKTENKSNPKTEIAIPSQILPDKMRFVNSYEDGKLLVETNEVECMIMSKDKSKIELLVNQQSLACAVFIL